MRNDYSNLHIPDLLHALEIKFEVCGSELWAPCPNPRHKETRPSWSIIHSPMTPENGTFNCFGCGIRGGPVNLVMIRLGVGYVAALQWIEESKIQPSSYLPIEITVEPIRKSPVLLAVPDFIARPLDKWVTPARKYLLSRGITFEQCERWELCYAIDGAMAGRVIFPVKNELGVWLGWHGRSYCDHEKRYKNSSSADGHNPGGIFGMRHWPALKERPSNTLVVCEGAIDALACERAGAEYIAAIGGSEPHISQLTKLQAWGRILVATDGDHAGDKVYDKLNTMIGSRVRVQRVAIPQSKDAAELTTSELKGLIDGARVM